MRSTPEDQHIHSHTLGYVIANAQPLGDFPPSDSSLMPPLTLLARILPAPIIAQMFVFVNAWGQLASTKLESSRTDGAALRLRYSGFKSDFVAWTRLRFQGTSSQTVMMYQCKAVSALYPPGWFWFLRIITTSRILSGSCIQDSTSSLSQESQCPTKSGLSPVGRSDGRSNCLSFISYLKRHTAARRSWACCRVRWSNPSMNSHPSQSSSRVWALLMYS